MHLRILAIFKITFWLCYSDVTTVFTGVTALLQLCFGCVMANFKNSHNITVNTAITATLL